MFDIAVMVIGIAVGIGASVLFAIAVGEIIGEIHLCIRGDKKCEF